jgi:uncharacterized protein with FMN-binding domain
MGSLMTVTSQLARQVSTRSFAAALSLAAPFAVLPAAHAAGDINEDKGQTEQEVQAELWDQASVDPAVMSAYKKLMAAIAVGDAERARITRAQDALKAARLTPGRDDDRRAARALSSARGRLHHFDAVAEGFKGTWDQTIETRLAELETQHHVTGGGPAAPAAPAADGVYAGKVSHKNPFGDVQVTLTVSGGKVTDCTATYPTAQQSGPINKAAVPTLCAEAVTAQSADIAAVGGASYTSPAFKDSLADAIRKAGL